MSAPSSEQRYELMPFACEVVCARYRREVCTAQPIFHGMCGYLGAENRFARRADPRHPVPKHPAWPAAETHGLSQSCLAAEAGVEVSKPSE